MRAPTEETGALSPADLRELASAREMQLADADDAAAHEKMMEGIGANADPDACRAFDRIAAVRATSFPTEAHEVIDAMVADVLPDDECWFLRGVMFEASRFTTDLPRIVQGAIDLARELDIEERTAIAVVTVAARDLRVRGITR